MDVFKFQKNKPIYAKIHSTKITTYKNYKASHALSLNIKNIDNSIFRKTLSITIFSSLLKRITSFFSSTISAQALAITLITATSTTLITNSAQAGSCTTIGGGVFDCSGAANGADITQSLTAGASESLVVTTSAGFGIATGAGDALSLNNSGSGDLTFTDNNGSDISGAESGIHAANFGTGATNIITTGTVSGSTYRGIDAFTNGTDLTINAQGSVSGNWAGINVRNDGDGATNITTQDVTSSSRAGIDVQNTYDSTSLTITTNGNISGTQGIYVNFSGSEDANIITNANVIGTSGEGIFAGIGDMEWNGSAITGALNITANGTVSGATDGIEAQNYGSSGLTINANGNITGSNGQGIKAFNSVHDVTGSMEINQAAGTSTIGSLNGIYANNAGGSLTINALGSTIGQAEDGIYAINQSSATDLTITANEVTGAKKAINAINNGTGALSISTTGTITSGVANEDSYQGIYARNAGTNLTINSSGIINGASYGIDAINNGTGALNITTAAVIGGIRAYNDDDDDGGDINFGTDLNITTNGIVQKEYGTAIIAGNYGTGELNIIANDKVIANGGDAIYASNSNGTDLTIITHDDVTGEVGIKAYGSENGMVNITTFGTVTGDTNAGWHGQGIVASSRGTGINITANGAVSGSEAGIEADLYDSGGDIFFQNNNNNAVLTITTQQAVIASDGMGIKANNEAKDLIIKTYGTVSGEYGGIYARNDGTGEINIISTKAISVSGEWWGNGITAKNGYVDRDGNSVSSGTDIKIDVSGAVSGIDNGILVENYGSGITTITASSAISAVEEYGINTKTSADKTTNIILNSGAAISSISGLGIYNNDGNSNITLNSGSSVSGTISLNEGDDNLIFAGGDFSNVTLFDGGANSDTDELIFAGSSGENSGTDRLTFAGSSGAIDSALIVNWEELYIDTGSTISFSNNALTTPSTTITNGGRLDAGTSFTLTGALTTTSSGVFDGTGAGSGIFNISGNVINNGIFTMQDNLVGDVANIEGDYSGSGTLKIDVNNVSQSDSLDVNGAVSLGGNLDIFATGLEADYAEGTSYDYIIIDNDLSDAVNGAFSNITTNFAFLEPSIDLSGGDGNDVVLTLTSPILIPDFVPFASTDNQINAAMAMNAFDYSSTDGILVKNAVIGLTNIQAQNALIQFSGVDHQASSGLGSLVSGSFRSIMGGRSSSFGKSGSQSSFALGYVSDEVNNSTLNAIDNLEIENNSYSSIWLKPFASYAKVDKGSSIADIHSFNAGVVLGYEVSNPDIGLAGISAGYTASKFSTITAGSTSKANNFSVGIYGSLGSLASNEGGWGILGILDYTYNAYETRRALVIGGLDRVAAADYGGYSIGGEIKASYGFETEILGSKTIISPFAGMNFLNSKNNAYSETGAGSLNISATETQTNRYASLLGLEISNKATLGSIPVNSRLSIGWQHEFGDVNQINTYNLQGSPTQFIVASPSEARDKLVLDAGIDFNMNENSMLTLSAYGEKSASSLAYGGNIAYKIKF